MGRRLFFFLSESLKLLLWAPPLKFALGTTRTYGDVSEWSVKRQFSHSKSVPLGYGTLLLIDE